MAKKFDELPKKVQEIRQPATATTHKVMVELGKYLELLRLHDQTRDLNKQHEYEGRLVDQRMILEGAYNNWLRSFTDDAQ